MTAPKKLAMLGFDSAMLHFIEDLIGQGLLPNFKRLFDNGTVADKAFCPYPTVTPPNWATLATGATAGTHQVTDFWIHKTGNNPTSDNASPAFNAFHVQAETVWEAAAKAGKKSIVLNYPGAWPIHEKTPEAAENVTIVGGCGLTVGTITDGKLAEDRGLPIGYLTGAQAFCYPHMISSQAYPLGVRAEPGDATGWKNVDEMGDFPLEVAFTLNLPLGITRPGRNTWYLLIRDMDDQGYDTIMLAPEKDGSKAFCTLRVGEWSSRIETEVEQADGNMRKVSFMAKLIELEEDAEDYALYLSEMVSPDGELWCHPPEKAARLLEVESTPTIMGGFQHRSMEWFDEAMFKELIEMHNKWLNHAAVALLTENEWDVFYMHTHPTDFIYHYLITQLDPELADSPERHEEAKKLHTAVYMGADQTLGAIMDILGEDVFTIVAADHGSVPDGSHFDPYDALTEAGLTTLTTADPNDLPDDFDFMPEAMKETEGITWTRKPVLKASKALPQRLLFIYVNLESRFPDGCVADEDYEKVQRDIIDALYAFKDPATGRHPVALALSKRDARLLGLYGEQCGDVVYAVHPEFSGQHGNILPTARWSIGTLQPLLAFHGPGVKSGFRMDRACNLWDVVPTACYLTGLPVPEHTEGAVIYQLLEDPNRKG